MVIIYALLTILAIELVLVYVYERIRDAIQRTRFNKTYANLPVKVLMTYALNNPRYSESYHDMRQIMPCDRAARIVVKRMLIDRGILKYRKEKL